MNAKHLILSALMGVIGGIAGFMLISRYSNDNPTEEISSNNQIVSTSPIHQVNESLPNSIPDISFTEAASSSLPTVVHITTLYNQPNYTLYDFIFGGEASSQRQVQSSGSGVIISSDGYIVTNNHVIDKSSQIQVILNDKRSFVARLIGTDPTTDIALLKIEEDELPYVDYGDSDLLQIGEWVLAVGNPFNLTSTVTAGIVSAKARNINILSGQYGIESFIQTDAAVNPGNSGGALVNTSGQLVGINTAIASRTGSYVGYSFAIPVNIVRKIVADLIEFGQVQRAYIGISMADLDSKTAERLNINTLNGVYVADVIKESAAEKSGMKRGDIITELNEIQVNSTTELLEQISKYRPGDLLNLKIERNSKSKELQVILQNKYGNTSIVRTDKLDIFGAEFENLTSREKQYYRLKYGLKIKKLYPGKLMSKGVREGFIITSVNNKPVKNLEHLKELIDNLNDDAIFIQGMYPDGNIAYYAFGLR